jgi:2-methylcitrate dehydratase PrpD
MTLTQQLAQWAARLRLQDIPEQVRAYAKSQLLSQLAAARATLAHELGAKLVRAFGSPLQEEDCKQAAFVLAALTLALDFDDTVYAGHVSHGAVGVPLAYRRALALDGPSLLSATVAAVECAARVTAAATIGPLRGQTAAHSHLIGSVIARLHAQQADPELIVAALGLALAMPPWPLQRAFLGSDAKALTAAVPVRIGLDACDAASAGLTGAADILEHPDGFLAKFAAVALPEAAVLDLGERWHTETVSLKVHPASDYLAAAIDCAIALHEQLPTHSIAPERVAEVQLHGSIFTAELHRQVQPYLQGARSPATALAFAPGYAIATALITGAFSPADLSTSGAHDPDRWALAAKVRVVEDRALTARAIAATAPVGEALRQGGTRTLAWVRAAGGEQAELLLSGLGTPAANFGEATKELGARVTVRFSDGHEATVARDTALGAAGAATREQHFELMRQKFLASGGSEEVVEAVAHLEELDDRLVNRLVCTALGR